MRLFVLLLLVVGLHTVGFAQPATKNVETLLQREMLERRIPGLQIAVVRNGKIVLLVGSKKHECCSAVEKAWRALVKPRHDRTSYTDER